MNDFAAQLDRWHDFHLLIGGAAATLMGLTFVAITLAPNVIAGRVSTAIRAFVTPIVAFFGTVLVVSLVLLVPHLAPAAPAVLLGSIGAGGLVYLVAIGTHRQWRTMELGFDDWIWYVGLPFLSYGALCASAIAWWHTSLWSPYAGAGAVIVLLIVGIRNAWDTVLTIAQKSQEPRG